MSRFDVDDRDDAAPAGVARNGGSQVPFSPASYRQLMLEFFRGLARIDQASPSTVALNQDPVAMTLPLSSELQHALHASPYELELVDPATNKHYVIVPKERWLERTAADRPGNGDANAEIWTDAKNQRRAELVDRQIAGTLTEEERDELERLQHQMRAYREKVAPLPIEDARRLHDELMERARKAQTGKG